MMTAARKRNQVGAAAVEAGIATPIVMFVFFLIFQSMFLGRAYLSAEYGSTAGARAGAIGANEAPSDYDVLMAIKRAVVATNQRDIVKVVVFKAPGPATRVPTECLSGPVAGKCNVYTSADFSRPDTDFGPGGWAGDDYWPSTDRGVNRTVGTDFLGVYVEIHADSIGGPFPKILNNQAITRLEARA